MSGVRKGTGGGPTVVFAAHTDTVFPEGTNLKVKREGDILRAPGIGDDTSNLMATLEMFRALDRGGVQTKGDLIFLASVQEELGLLGAKHWLETSGYKPDIFVAVDLSSDDVWYGALRIDQIKFFYTSPGAHTLESRGAPSPAKAVAKAITALYEIPLPPGRPGPRQLQAAHPERGHVGRRHRSQRHPPRGMVHRGPALARQRHAGSSGERRRLYCAAHRRSGRRRLPRGSKNGHRLFQSPAAAGAAQPPLVQTALATANHFRKSGTPAIEPRDVGSTDANIAVSMGIPAVAVGAVIEHLPHRLEENAEASSIVPGIKHLIALAVALTSH